VLGAVDPEVTALAGGDYVCWDEADRVAVAEVGDGEADLAARVARGCVVEFGAAAGVWVWGVEAALAGAFAAAVGAREADAGAEVVPSGWEVACWYGH
jgi:hypothetical protein